MAYRDNLKQEETSKSFWHSNALFESKENSDNDISRCQIGYLYCVICDSQMETKIMWENHIKENRHFINSQNFEYRNEDPSIKKELDTEARPIAGLDHIYEVLCSNRLTVYQCLLCPAGLTTKESLLKHIMGLAHKMAFLKEHVKEEFSLLHSSELKVSEMEPVVNEILTKYERKHGRAKIFVMRAKKRPEHYISGYKNFFNVDSDKRFLPKYASYSPSQKSFRYSPTKSDGMKESESEWKYIPVSEEYRKISYRAKPYYSYAEVPKSAVYNKAPDNLEIQDIRLERDSFYNPAWPSRYEGGTWKDAGVYIDEEKNIGKAESAENSNMEPATFSPSSPEINGDSDAFLRLVDDISPTLFLRLALFKLEKMNVKKGTELKLLDRLVDKASELALQVKKKILSENMKYEFKESLHTNSTPHQEQSMVDTSSHSSLQFAQNSHNFTSHYNTCNTNVSKNEKVSDSSDLRSSDRKKSLSQHQLNDISAERNSPEIEVIYDSALHRL